MLSVDDARQGNTSVATVGRYPRNKELSVSSVESTIVSQHMGTSPLLMYPQAEHKTFLATKVKPRVFCFRLASIHTYMYFLTISMQYLAISKDEEPCRKHTSPIILKNIQTPYIHILPNQCQVRSVARQ